MDSSSSRLMNYLFIYSTEDDLGTRKKNRAVDHSEGIFHFNIGSDSGIIKERSFNKENHKHLEEALLTTQPTGESLEAYRRIYNADIKMYGNSSFIIGQHIYIDPTTVGLGDPSSVISNGTDIKLTPARILGLGGNFLVTKVQNEISSGDFSTNISARWVSFGDGIGKTKSELEKAKEEKKIKCDNLTYEKIKKVLEDGGVDVRIPSERPIGSAYGAGYLSLGTHIGRYIRKGWRWITK